MAPPSSLARVFLYFRAALSAPLCQELTGVVRLETLGKTNEIQSQGLM